MGNVTNINELIGTIPGYNPATNTYSDDRSLVKAQLEMLVMGSATQRFHTVRTTSLNTVGEHSHGVAMLCWMALGSYTSVGLLMAALTHDLAEHKVGDMPAPAKRALGVRAEFGKVEELVLDAAYMAFALDDLEQLVLKWADAADGCLFCVRESMLGNRGIYPAWQNYSRYLHECTTRLKEWAALTGREKYRPVLERAALLEEQINFRWNISLS